MSRLALPLLTLCAIFLYGTLLTRVPVHLNQDEVGFSLNAYSLAKTGLDDNGRRLPLYFWHLNVMWATPIIVYLTAFFLKIFPLSETIIRLPSVLVGVLNIALTYLLAQKLFNDWKWSILAGALLLTTPIHFIQSRILLDNLYPVPFILGWLICLYIFLKKNSTWSLLLGVFLLGIGIHSYHATKIMMPLYFFATLVVIRDKLEKNPRLTIYTILAFALPVLPLVWWLQKYPDTLIDQVKYTGIYDTKLPPALGFLTLLSPRNLLHRIDVYISFFKPIFLFLKGDQSLIHSTRMSGAFLLPFFVFLPVGLWVAWKKQSAFYKLLVFGFFTSPLAAVIAGDHYRISRALFILPFAILLATLGIQKLILGNRRLTYILLLLIPLQFTFFWYDYMKGYRVRSYQWFNYNIPGALEAAIKNSNGREKIYLDHRVEFIEKYWQFYLLKHDQMELLQKTVYADLRAIEPGSMPKNSLLVFQFNNVDGNKQTLGPFKKVETIIEPDGTSRFFLYAN